MYHQFKNEDGEAFGSFEVFHVTSRWNEPAKLDDPNNGAGFYWQACFPGCLPDGEAFGPFETEEEAIEDAQSLAFSFHNS